MPNYTKIRSNTPLEVISESGHSLLLEVTAEKVFGANWFIRVRISILMGNAVEIPTKLTLALKLLSKHVIDWNNLSAFMVIVPSVEVFKGHLERY